jgi:hypothetical protein
MTDTSFESNTGDPEDSGKVLPVVAVAAWVDSLGRVVEGTDVAAVGVAAAGVPVLVLVVAGVVEWVAG